MHTSVKQSPAERKGGLGENCGLHRCGIAIPGPSGPPIAPLPRKRISALRAVAARRLHSETRLRTQSLHPPQAALHRFPLDLPHHRVERNCALFGSAFGETERRSVSFSFPRKSRAFAGAPMRSLVCAPRAHGSRDLRQVHALLKMIESPSFAVDERRTPRQSRAILIRSAGGGTHQLLSPNSTLGS